MMSIDLLRKHSAFSISQDNNLYRSFTPNRESCWLGSSQRLYSDISRTSYLSTTMGASTSKTASKAASAATRRAYPSRTSAAPEPTRSSKTKPNIGTHATAPGGSPTSESPQGNAVRAAASEAFQTDSARRGPSPTQQTQNIQSRDPQYEIPENRPGPTVHSNAGPSETRNEGAHPINQYSLLASSPAQPSPAHLS